MLKLEGVKAAYGKIPVLHGVSLEVPQGQLITLLGANGAGKTTTLKVISGLIKPFSGSIWFMGERIEGLPPYQIVNQGISHCPEGRKIWPYMTVKENLELGGYLTCQKALSERMNAVYKYFPILDERREQLAGSLSGGEQQMLAIGRALMSGPKILLLDEPSMGLSPIIVEKIAEIIKSILVNGMTILLVEQNAHLALGLADWGYVIETGKIILQDHADKLLSNDHLRRAYLGT